MTATLNDDNEYPIPANERDYHHGGLMRCCVATITETTTLTKVGSTMRCKYESQDKEPQLVVGEDGLWKWTLDA